MSAPRHVRAGREAPLPRKADLRYRMRDRNWLVYRALIPAIRETAEHARGRLLDLGCGNRPYRELFEPRCDACVGLDVEQSDGKQVDVLADLSGRLPFGDGSFDTVLCTQVLEHTQAPWLVVRDIARVLRPGGCLLLSVPCYWRIHEPPHDFYRFTRFGVQELARQAGLEVVRLEANGGFWSLWGQALLNHLACTIGEHAWIHVPVNAFCALMERAVSDPDDTMNLVAVLRRPEA